MLALFIMADDNELITSVQRYLHKCDANYHHKT